MKKLRKKLKTAAKREEALQNDAELDAEGSRRRLFNCRCNKSDEHSYE
jgi:hypothetical protein